MPVPIACRGCGRFAVDGAGKRNSPPATACFGWSSEPFFALTRRPPDRDRRKHKKSEWPGRKSEYRWDRLDRWNTWEHHPRGKKIVCKIRNHNRYSGRRKHRPSPAGTQVMHTNCIQYESHRSNSGLGLHHRSKNHPGAADLPDNAYCGAPR